MAVFFNTEGKVIYDSEDFVGRLNRAMEAVAKHQIYPGPQPRMFTAEDIAAMKAAPVLLLVDSMPDMS